MRDRRRPRLDRDLISYNKRYACTRKAVEEPRPFAHKYRLPGFGGRFSAPWPRLLIGSVTGLVIAGAVIGAVGLSSATTSTVFARLPLSLSGIELRVQSGDVAIVGGSQNGVSINREDRSAFAPLPREQRSISSGILRISSDCPELLMGSCTASYQIGVPNDVPISIRTEQGNIRLDGYHGSADIATNSGAINVEGYCGFVLGAASASGNVSVLSSCSPERLILRSDTGNVSAAVPAGDYAIQAASNDGRTTVRGLVDDGGAPWAIEAFSNTGNVSVSADR